MVDEFLGISTVAPDILRIAQIIQGAIIYHRLSYRHIEIFAHNFSNPHNFSKQPIATEQFSLLTKNISLILKIVRRFCALLMHPTSVLTRTDSTIFRRGVTDRPNNKIFCPNHFFSRLREVGIFSLESINNKI
jgi:hypothetical protein